MALQIWTEAFWVTTRSGHVGKYRQRIGGMRCFRFEGRRWTYGSEDLNVRMATECFLETLVTI
jgi:hypothetical protein